ncbi:mycofactocin biosynthesis glycosyltransferase MftF [Hoyosella rhizosphaerae]|uniref:Glycosyltransferase n=1 Tax=Hoyosella rhizosphaerae TaxID=1755582 RepID=A0A916UHX3_9ACTN|nr:mycofactocin biosynthesis glycosyltransferase MftF [Hoyosella rhizosphaerae]MBN4928220.1 mycofactocin biosynthesis glycosyltransferase MftF [Hoyosella rhizosphaerae]GGC73334.1 putative glycosyltransferase [Hoyosella rhizosphaerae]
MRLDSRVRVADDGSALFAPWGRVMRLSSAEQAMLDEDTVEVVDNESSRLARHLLDVEFAHPRPLKGPSWSDLTVVIAARDEPELVQQLVANLPDLPVIVVDDGSAVPLTCSGATIVRHEHRCGVAEARNTGLRAAHTPFVVFLDPGVVPGPLWVEAMLAHFADPDVALVVPRIAPLPHRKRWIGQYEAMRPTLDPGRRECSLHKRKWDYSVPTTALMVRRQAVVKVGGFDGAFPAFNATDMCVRLAQNGWRLRFDPVAVMRAPAPASVRRWFEWRAASGYGSARVYATKARPRRLQAATKLWLLLGSVLLLVGARRAAVISAAVGVVHTVRLARELPREVHPWVTAAAFNASSWSGSVRRVAEVALRNLWPLTLLAAVVSPRVRTVVIVAALAEGAADWWSRRDAEVRIDLVRFVLLRRLDDIAFGWGLWRGFAEVRYGASGYSGLRNDAGVVPVHLLNARRNALDSENPSVVAM